MIPKGYLIDCHCGEGRDTRRCHHRVRQRPCLRRRGDQNPLTMIGLTPAILGLGLTQDELYEYCTRIARALFACVHPDRHNGTQRPEALHFSEAFALLKDRQVFNAAIKEFQGQRRQGSAPTTRRSARRKRCACAFRNCKDATLC